MEVAITVLIGAVGLGIWAVYRTWRQGRDIKQKRKTDDKHRWDI